MSSTIMETCIVLLSLFTLFEALPYQSGRVLLHLEPFRIFPLAEPLHLPSIPSFPPDGPPLHPFHYITIPLTIPSLLCRVEGL